MQKKDYSSLKRGRSSPNAKRITVYDSKSNSSSQSTNSNTKPGIFSESDPRPSKRKKSFIYTPGAKYNDNSNDTISAGSSTLSYIPQSDPEESGDDNDGLIDIDSIPMTKPSSAAPKLDFTKGDDILENAAKMNKEVQRESSRPSSRKSDGESNHDIVENVLSNNSGDISAVRDRFKSKKIPELSCSKTQLQQRVEKYLDLVPQFLNGTSSMSYFYDLAKAQKSKVPHETLRQRDKYLINWDEFTGGYYGLKRQFYISSLILARYKQDLVQKAKKNPTLLFWGIEDFSRFILANEMILRLVMEDYNCDLLKAEKIVSSTPEYGRVVSDSQELDDDIVNKEDEKQKEKGAALEALFGSD